MPDIDLLSMLDRMMEASHTRFFVALIANFPNLFLDQ